MEWDNALLHFMWNKYINANMEQNLSTWESIEKYKKLVDTQYEKKKKRNDIPFGMI